MTFLSKGSLVFSVPWELLLTKKIQDQKNMPQIIKEKIAHLGSYTFYKRCWSILKQVTFTTLSRVSFKKLAVWRLATSWKTPTHVFSCEVFEIFKNTFPYWTPPVTTSTPPVAASVFFSKRYYLAVTSQPCYDVLIIFSSRHIVWCIKSRTRLFINLSSVVTFSK